MAKSKKGNKSQSKPSVRVQDLQPGKNPKGGAVNKFKAPTPEGQLDAGVKVKW